jgi:ribosomal protein S18 acetylase RimI-like enzyme
MCAIQIRPAAPDDAPFLVSMLLEAVNFSPEGRQDPAVVLSDPQVAHYITGWPQAGDRGLVAVNDEGLPLGACWLRYRPVSDPGYGYVAADIPELSIAVRREARGQGIGRALLRAIAAEALTGGVTMLSLSVEHANKTASHLYRSEGWRILKSETDADTMLLDLREPQPNTAPPADRPRPQISSSISRANRNRHGPGLPASAAGEPHRASRQAGHRD